MINFANDMGKKILFMIGVMLIMATMSMAANRKFTLVIDAGHGGHDAGALGAKSKEKNINLKVALAFGKLVEKNCPDVKVIYTRKTDVFITLNERAHIANRNKADLFVSVHTNALPGGRIARGFEVYTLGMHKAAENLDVAKRENSVILVEKNYKQHYEGFDPKSSESYIMFEFIQDKNMAKSVELARYIQKEVCALASRPNKGVHQAGFLVLRETSMPSCLIELGFITTPDEENLLNSEKGINNHARGIYKAFLRYKKKYYGGINVPFDAGGDQSVNIPTVVPPAENKKKEQDNKKETEQQEEIKKEPETKQEADRQEPKQEQTDEQPVFKVQIIASDRPIASGSRQFKGLKDIEMYKEGNMVKYTTGASTNYNEIYRLRKTILDKFPNAFIIAFKNGEKMDVRKAIREYKANKGK